MSQLSEAIHERLDNLPQAQRTYFNYLIDKGEKDIFATIAEIRKTEIPPDQREPAGLALASLNEMLNGPAPEPVTEEQAMDHLHEEMGDALAVGDKQRAAMALQGIEGKRLMYRDS